jgi:predicted acetyltransferase
VHTHASFFAAGITHNIVGYILEDKLFHIDPYQYTVYQLRIVKEYVERAIARKNAKLYDGIKGS